MIINNCNLFPDLDIQRQFLGQSSHKQKYHIHKAERAGNSWMNMNTCYCEKVGLFSNQKHSNYINSTEVDSRC